jgi:hypothetical protein
MDHESLIKVRFKLTMDQKELDKAKSGYNYTYENTFLPTYEEKRRLETEIKLGDQAKCTKEWLYIHKKRLPPEILGKEPLTLMERCRFLTRDIKGAAAAEA